MADVYTSYEIGLKRLLEQLGTNHPCCADVSTFQSRLLENLANVRKYGDSENLRSERNRILAQLHQLALETVGRSFNELCDLDQAAVEPSAATYNVADTMHPCSLIADQDVPDPILLLGGGASQKSGVPQCGSLVELAAKWTYCRIHQRVLDDPTIRRSDWLPWLHGLDWYNAHQPPDAQYIVALRNLLQSVEVRRDFFHKMARPAVPPSRGYHQLIQLMAAHRVRTVITSNFDAVLPALADTVPNPRRVTVIRSPGDCRHLSTAPIYPQIVYLFGDAEHYADYYFSGGYERLNDALVEHLVPLLRDHPLIVVGYRGSEPAVMNHLLLGIVERTYHFQHGIYWCVLNSEPLEKVHPLVTQLANAVCDSFRFVRITDFDDLLMHLYESFRQVSVSPPSIVIEQPEVLLTFDMKPIPDITLDSLDWVEVQERLLTYCRQMGISMPSSVSREWLIERMQVEGLVQTDGDSICPTVAGYLLFGKNPIDHLPTAQLQVYVSGEEPVLFSGNLWQQLDVIDWLDMEFNVPFRLKGRNSETVTPYPSLALKEVIVNALAHRRYDGEATEAVVICVEPDYVTVTSPGGLHEAARRQLPPDISPEEALGTCAIKGYRNPVIADFLYSRGAMDKLGSGLLDVRKWVRQTGGEVRFRLGESDTFFKVTIYRRPEQPDDTTGAATPLTLTGEFISNVLAVDELPTSVWSDETTYRWVPDILRQDRDQSLPAFILCDRRFYTFSDLSNPDNPLRQYTQGTDIRSIPLNDFAVGDVGERRLVNLLNEALRNCAESKGLIFDWKRKRAYFPRTEEGERTITYQARLRQATRTVVKARISSTTGQVVYWEHQTVEFHFKRFGETWGMQLLPTYVFTIDGKYDRLPGERGGPLATRRLSREYNVHVDNHLVFWTAILSGENPTFCLEDTLGSCICLRSTPASCILHALELQPEGEEPPLPGEEELDELEEQLWDLVGEEEDVTDDDSGD